MNYRVIGLMSGSSLDGLDIAFAEFEEQAGKWTFEIRNTSSNPYPDEWVKRLQNASALNAYDYLLLHCDYGHWLGEQVNEFIRFNHLDYKIQLVASHGHTVFHAPARKMTAQLGDGAALAAVTGLPVVSDLRSMDLARGGQGAPIVPIGEKLLWSDFDLFLNLGGIANLTAGERVSASGAWQAFDVCPANRVLNLIAGTVGKLYDEDGKLAAEGKPVPELLSNLNSLDYYGKPYPKSLANEFGTDFIFPMIKNYDMSTEDALFTYVEHIIEQVGRSVKEVVASEILGNSPMQMLVTGGGALNLHLASRLKMEMSHQKIDVVIPEKTLINFKEALVMALIGIMRWRDEPNTMSTVTGATSDSINGAVYMGRN